MLSRHDIDAIEVEGFANGDCASHALRKTNGRNAYIPQAQAKPRARTDSPGGLSGPVCVHSVRCKHKFIGHRIGSVLAQLLQANLADSVKLREQKCGSKLL